MKTTFTTDIRLNSLGFLPFQKKKASISIPCTSFSVINTENENEEFVGKTSGPVFNEDTEEEIYVADFSDISASGHYYLKVDGVGQSFKFEIGENIYLDSFRTAMMGMYLWRCGTEVSASFNGVTFGHKACHLQDAWVDYRGEGTLKKRGVGGWHDAGDYNKYVVNAGITLYLMYMAWEQFGDRIEKIKHIPENISESNLPHYLQELKWEIDWLFSMQFEDGSVSHKLSTKTFCGFIMPEEEASKRYFSEWGSAATADFCALLAAAAGIFTKYDSNYSDRCIRAAVKSYEFLNKNSENHLPDQSDFATGMYCSDDFDHRLWASVELWQATGESRYLFDFEERTMKLKNKIDFNFNWNNVKNLGMIRYIFSEKKGKKQDLVEKIISELKVTADLIVQTGASHGYGRTLGKYYCWGANGNLLNQVLLLQSANRIKTDTKYLDASLDAIGYVFGRNFYCRSFVTGIGFNPPKHPHDRRAGGDNIEQPWPGYLVGGPEQNATDYQDLEQDCRTNEIAINWNAALIYALAGFIK